MCSLAAPRRPHLRPHLAGDTLIQHKDLAVLTIGAGGMNSDRIQLQALHRRFDIERHHAQGGAQACRAQGRFTHHGKVAADRRNTGNAGAAGDKAFHEKAVRGVDVRLQRLGSPFAQLVRQLPRLAMAAAVNRYDRLQPKILQGNRRHLDAGVQSQQPPVQLCLAAGKKEHAALTADQHLQRAAGRGKPQLQLNARGGVPPLPGQQETFTLHPGRRVCYARARHSRPGGLS
jgi:hypothetical protein